MLHTKVLSILHAKVLIRTISMAQSHPCILCHATPPNPLFVPLLLNNFYVLSLIIVVTANSIDKMHVTANASNVHGSYYLRAAFVARIIYGTQIIQYLTLIEVCVQKIFRLRNRLDCLALHLM